MNRETDENRVIDAFLSESDESAPETLRSVLLELRSMSSAEAPEPCAELQQLFAPRNVTVLDDRRHRRRTVITTIAVVASMGLGASGVAALSPEFRVVAEDVVSRLFTPPSAENELVDIAQRESAILPVTDPLKSRTLPDKVPDKAVKQVTENTEDRAARPESVRRNATAPGKQVSEAAKTGIPGQSAVRGNSAEVRTVPELPEAVPAESPARVRTLVPAEKAAPAPPQPAQLQPAPARGADNAQVKAPAAATTPNRPMKEAARGQKPPAGLKAK